MYWRTNKLSDSRYNVSSSLFVLLINLLFYSDILVELISCLNIIWIKSAIKQCHVLLGYSKSLHMYLCPYMYHVVTNIAHVGVGECVCMCKGCCVNPFMVLFPGARAVVIDQQ